MENKGRNAKNQQIKEWQVNFIFARSFTLSPKRRNAVIHTGFRI